MTNVANIGCLQSCQITDGFEEVKNRVKSNAELYKIADETTRFLEGFYSDYALELLSTLDYIMMDKRTEDKNVILRELSGWSNRKRSMFSNEMYIDISLNHLTSYISSNDKQTIST